jgi:hypothetical protein
MGRACDTNGEKWNGCRILVGKPEGKRPLGRQRRRWVDNIKIDLREIGWDGTDWIELAQDREILQYLSDWRLLKSDSQLHGVSKEISIYCEYNAGHMYNIYGGKGRLMTVRHPSSN